MNTQTIPLDHLRPHPDNSNIMPEPLVSKLADHIQRTGRYPPLIVRPLYDDRATAHTAHTAPKIGRFQILDGHHRALAIKKASLESAECVVWEADDQEALILLATLNRLQGHDDPCKRASLLTSLANQHSLKQLTGLLPERAEQIKKYLEFKTHPPAPRKPKPIEQMPVAVYFFLMPEQRSTLNRALRRHEGSREEALMKMVALSESTGPPETSRATT